MERTIKKLERNMGNTSHCGLERLREGGVGIDMMYGWVGGNDVGVVATCQCSPFIIRREDNRMLYLYNPYTLTTLFDRYV